MSAPDRGQRHAAPTIERKKQTVSEFLCAQVAKAAGEWQAIMRRDGFAYCYLYYRSGELAVFAGESTPAGWTLGCAERLHGFLTREQVVRKIDSACRSLPFLPLDL